MSTGLKVLVLGGPLDYVGRDHLAQFEEQFHVDVLPAKDRVETIKLLPGKVEQDGPYYAFVIKFGTLPYEPYDEELLSGLGPQCKIITSCSAGFNEFDVDWMTRAGYWFCNTVNAVSEPTADMAMLLILATVRGLRIADKQAREGGWRTGLTPSRDPVGMTLGIVGMGAIGKFVAKKAVAFNMKVKYHNRHRLPEDEEKKYAASYCETLHELLSSSELISINCPLTAQTTNLISTSEFASMRDGSFLVNTARGAIVNEEALIAALSSGKLAGAGLDVFPEEPNINPYFLTSDNVIIQPHMGGLTRSAYARSEQECLENIRALCEKGKPNSPVNKIGD